MPHDFDLNGEEPDGTENLNVLQIAEARPACERLRRLAYYLGEDRAA